MLLERVVYLLLLKLVATVPISPTGSSGPVIGKGRYEPGVHTINNANPYQGVRNPYDRDTATLTESVLRKWL